MRHLHQVNRVPCLHTNQLAVFLPVLLCRLQKLLRRQKCFIPKLVLVKQVEHREQTNLGLGRRQPVLVLGAQAGLLRDDELSDLRVVAEEEVLEDLEVHLGVAGEETTHGG